MSSVLPSPANGYLWTAEIELTPETFNSVFGSIHGRLVDCEAITIDAQAAIGQLLAITAEGARLLIEDTTVQNNAILELTQARFTQIAQEYDELQNGGLKAPRVQVNALPGYASTALNVQATLEAIGAEVVYRRRRINVWSLFMGGD
ncbi:hypothetical protein [Antarcticirhabdus aurantiaca]|uniref:Uncharacterized protein n=1 Tax=Antarcticirhabdus aurantiaca TaxID=2606717 RepID=A0ACD4NJ67_9HYPH|nr:hypothetical protein OXU80_18540 [Jeongeuplla avenae]